jgi:DNA-directed RNA polymerase I subunit RPA1
MVGLAETAASTCLVRSHGGIGRAFQVEQLLDGENRLALQTEGSDFLTLWGLSAKDGGELLDLPCLSSNHIWGTSTHYGVEACRAAITKEIAGVFAVYGIGVDARHLGLIADYMTFYGGYRPMNRAGMRDIASPCLQMSFETTAAFLVQAALDGKADKLKSPSGRIVVGQPITSGTGSFDLMLPVEVAA